MNAHTQSVVEEVGAERERQVQKGWTREHDDRHTTHDLVMLAQQRAHKPGAAGRGLYSRQRLIEAAAMLVAAVEAMDRHQDSEVSA